MRKLKIVTAVVLLSCFLSLGNPGSVRAASAYEMPPAIVFVQDRNSKMLLKHNFVSDDGILKNFDTEVDTGFYVNVENK